MDPGEAYLRRLFADADHEGVRVLVFDTTRPHGYVAQLSFLSDHHVVVSDREVDALPQFAGMDLIMESLAARPVPYQEMEPWRYTPAPRSTLRHHQVRNRQPSRR